MPPKDLPQAFEEDINSLEKQNVGTETADYFTSFGIDLRKVYSEYRNFPWSEAISQTLRPGEALPPKPKFNKFAMLIKQAAVLLKARELYKKGRQIESTIDPRPFTFGPGYRGPAVGRPQITPEDQAKLKESGRYKAAEKTILHVANPTNYSGRTVEGMSPFVWSELVRGKIGNLESTQLLAQNSEFVDDILARTEPVPVTNPYGTGSQSPKVDLATLIKPKAIPK